MDNLRKQADRFGAQFLTDDVTRVDLTSDVKTVWVGQQAHQARAVILATGSAWRPLSVPGETELLGHGVSSSSRYRSMLISLRDDHRGRSLFCYLDMSLAETLRRHLTRPQPSEFTAEHTSGWYAAHDVLDWPGELVLPETTGLDEAVEVIAAVAGLSQTGRDDDVPPSVPSQ